MTASASKSEPYSLNEFLAAHSTVFGEAVVRRIAGGFGFTEGPVWLERDNTLIFSDIPQSTMWKWDDTVGLSLFRYPSSHANGNSVFPNGDLVTCQHGTRSITRTKSDGSVETLVDRFMDKRFNSPNDIVVDSTGVVWFTDPPYGLDGGHTFEPGRELDGNHVFRFDPATAEIDIVASDLDRPNGLAFSPDESILYIADSGLLRGQGPDGNEVLDYSKPRHIRRFLVERGRYLKPAGVLAEISVGAPDGIRVDLAGNIWSSAGDGVHCFGKDGAHLAMVPLPEVVGNLAFDQLGRLFVTASSSLYRIELNWSWS